MVDLTDPNLGYLIGGLLAFWLPMLGYLWSLRSRTVQADAELDLLQQELSARDA
jgi:hypothetical protein